MAVSLQSAIGHFFDGDGLIPPIRRHQTVAGQPCPVKAAGFVEAPVLGNAQLGIVVPLVNDIFPPGTAGSDFQDEVRRLALLVYDVTVAPFVSFDVGVESY